MRTLIAALAATALLVTPAAAVPDDISINSHGVVTASTLPHCPNEYPPVGDRPCTWNIGPMQDGDGNGLQYWLGTEGVIHYVWNRSPLIDHPERHWLDGRPRCWAGPSGVGHCPNGNTVE